MNEKIETPKTASDKLSDFVFKQRKILIIATVAVVGIVIALVVGNSVSTSTRNKSIASIERIEYELKDGSSDLEKDELEERRQKALTELATYMTKSGIVGARANLLAAELQYDAQDFESALSLYESVISKGDKFYFTPLALYNAGSCCEELARYEEAVSYYKRAADKEDFVFKAHARFSVGRVQELLEQYDAAYASYDQLINATPNDTWADLAKSRQIALKTSGNVK